MSITSNSSFTSYEPNKGVLTSIKCIGGCNDNSCAHAKGMCYKKCLSTYTIVVWYIWAKKLTILYCHMATKVLKVLKPFFSIVINSSWKKMYNMLVQMFDPRFKRLKIVTKYLNSSKMALEMANEYDWKVLLPFLSKGYK
jgi:hypothetical protein